MGKSKRQSKGPADRAQNGNPQAKAKSVEAKPAKQAAKPKTAEKKAASRAESKPASKAAAKKENFLDGIIASIKKLLHSH